MHRSPRCARPPVVIAKGNLHGDGAKLASYLITGRNGERAELVELHGFIAGNIRAAFAGVELQAAATRCVKPFFHGYVRLPPGETLSRNQWRHVADRVEQQLGFAGQGRAIVFHHRPAGDTHMHIAWSRIDLEQRRALDPGLYKNKLKEISRQLECELGLARVSNELPPGRKTRAPGRREFEQARRLGMDLPRIREAIRACWDLSPDGRRFMAALAMHGLVLARGDRRDFVVLDHAGGLHALSKRITGATAAETRKRLAGIDAVKLPSVYRAKIRDTIAPDPGAAALPVAGENERRAPKLALETEKTEQVNFPAAAPVDIAAAHDVPAALAAVETHEALPASFGAERERASPRPAPRAAPAGIFRKVAGELARRANSVQPAPRRRRREDTGRAFTAAKKIVRRAVALPAVYAAAAYLSDTLDWLNLWQDNDTGPDEGFEASAANHLSPRL